MRSPSLVAVAVLVAACTTPDREFPSEEATSTGTGVSTSSSGTPTSSSGPGGGSDGGGGSSAAPASSSSQGGSGPGCGNGVVDEGEACDEDTPLCVDCAVDCPSGWFALGNSCFAVALNDVAQYDAFTADAKCGALDVGASGHRAHAATPSSLDELDSLATRCPNNGCWLGLYGLGAPSDLAFSAPATGEALLESPPWADGDPSGGVDEVCLKLLLSDDGGPLLQDQPCGQLGYFACELETTFGSFATCGDGAVDAAEECDEASERCVGCDRRCPDGWTEDPRSHACLTTVTGGTWDVAAAACGDVGAGLATPDDVADMRVAQALGSDLWLGLDATVPSSPTWVSGEAFDFAIGEFPVPDGPPAASYGLLSSGVITFGDTAADHDALCEAHAPVD